jgi:hypothetical protein
MIRQEQVNRIVRAADELRDASHDHFHACTPENDRAVNRCVAVMDALLRNSTPAELDAAGVEVD